MKVVRCPAATPVFKHSRHIEQQICYVNPRAHSYWKHWQRNKISPFSPCLPAAAAKITANYFQLWQQSSARHALPPKKLLKCELYHFNQLYLNQHIPTVHSYGCSHLTSTPTIPKHIYTPLSSLKAAHAIKTLLQIRKEATVIPLTRRVAITYKLPLKHTILKALQFNFRHFSWQFSSSEGKL